MRQSTSIVMTMKPASQILSYVTVTANVLIPLMKKNVTPVPTNMDTHPGQIMNKTSTPLSAHIGTQIAQFVPSLVMAEMTYVKRSLL